MQIHPQTQIMWVPFVVGDPPYASKGGGNGKSSKPSPRFKFEYRKRKGKRKARSCFICKKTTCKGSQNKKLCTKNKTKQIKKMMGTRRYDMTSREEQQLKRHSNPNYEEEAEEEAEEGEEDCHENEEEDEAKDGKKEEMTEPAGHFGEETQSHLIEDGEGKELSHEQLLEAIKSLKQQLQQTIKVKKEYKKRAEETDKKLKAKDKKLEQLTAALERIRGPKRKTRGREGNAVNPEEEKEELIRNLSTHNVRLGQSKIKGAGIGVFAMTTIRKDTKLFQINGEPSGDTIILTKREIAKLPPHVQTVVKAYLLPDEITGFRHVPKNGLSFALGVSWYLNTADGTGMEPNVEFGDELDAFGFKDMITTRQIEKDEELLLSYDVNDTK